MEGVIFYELEKAEALQDIFFKLIAKIDKTALAYSKAEKKYNENIWILPIIRNGIGWALIAEYLEAKNIEVSTINKIDWVNPKNI